MATLEAAVTYLQQLLPGRSMTRGGGYRDPELLRALSMDRTRSGILACGHALLVHVDAAGNICSNAAMQKLPVGSSHDRVALDFSYCFVKARKCGPPVSDRFAIAGKLVHSHSSSASSKQQQQRMILGDHGGSSLLDVDSDLPLSFALDTQMLPLAQPPLQEQGWCRQMVHMAFGF